MFVTYFCSPSYQTMPFITSFLLLASATPCICLTQNSTWVSLGKPSSRPSGRSAWLKNVPVLLNQRLASSSWLQKELLLYNFPSFLIGFSAEQVSKGALTNKTPALFSVMWALQQGQGRALWALNWQALWQISYDLRRNFVKELMGKMLIVLFALYEFHLEWGSFLL